MYVSTKCGTKACALCFTKVIKSCELNLLGWFVVSNNKQRYSNLGSLKALNVQYTSCIRMASLKVRAAKRLLWGLRLGVVQLRRGPWNGACCSCRGSVVACEIGWG